MVQLIERQKCKFCFNIYGIECVFMPMELFIGNGLMPLDKKVKGSTLGWYVNRKWVSYNQLRNTIKELE